MSTFAENDLSFSQVRVLMVLAYVDRALPINQIATHLNITFASVGRNVESLLHEGLVERDEDPVDRRVKLVQLTSVGRDLVSRHFECHRTALAEFTQGLTDSDRSRIAAALGPVLEGDLLARTPSTLIPPAGSSGSPTRKVPE